MEMSCPSRYCDGRIFSLTAQTTNPATLSGTIRPAPSVAIATGRASFAIYSKSSWTRRERKMKTKARRIKAQPPKPPAAVTVTLSSNDFGQMMDGLRSRLESWDNTVLHFDGESEYDMQVEECSDQEEARNIANHYRALIADL